MIDPNVLDAVEAEVSKALRTGSVETLDVVGYGEISTVIRVDTGGEAFAAKRLPSMTRGQFEAYAATVTRYLDALSRRGIRPAVTEVHAVGGDPVVPYCVQLLEPLILVDELASADPEKLALWIGQLVESIVAVVDERLGLDAQVSNWAVRDEALVYFDVTTPFMRHDDGSEMLDLDVFIAALPWVARGGVKRFLLESILSDYYDARAVVLNTAGNLLKERLFELVDMFLDSANHHVNPPITGTEVERYYRRDSLVWGLLQMSRRADRSWQRTVRRRSYPFLLPGPIER